MDGFKTIFAIIGRILLSSIFLWSGLNKVLEWESSLSFLQSSLDAWKSYAGPSGLYGMIPLIQAHLPFCLMLAVTAELLGGFLVIVGFIPRFGAILLILFLIPTTLVVHPYWFMQSPQRDLQLIMFMKNIAILGGLFIVLGLGSGFRSRIKF